MSKCILLIFEGQVTEHDIIKNIQKFYLNTADDNAFILSSHCGDIYSLYHKIKKDDDLDIFYLIKKIKVNSHLEEIKRKSISEIYLFFDYDGHATSATDEKLEEMLNYFNEETERGKLYISYPMVEALKHIPADDFENLTVAAKSKIGYKGKASEECLRKYVSFKQYTINEWKELNTLHLKKANKIISNQFSLPSENIEQIKIFKGQKEGYIIPNNTVSVLSAYPCFLFDYYGCDNIELII